MSAAMKTYDVVIVGGGVVGSASAHYLRKNGFTGSIALVEKDTSWARGCTALSVGGLRLQFSTPENIHLSKFGVTLVKNLKQEFGPDADIGFKEQGYLICASPEGLPVLEENHTVQIANGADNVLLRGQELASRFPWLVTDGIAAGCFGLSGEGWVDPYMFAALFRKSAIAKGVELIQDEVTGVTREGQRITGVTLASGEAIACGTLVNAAGTGAGRLAELAGIYVGRGLTPALAEQVAIQLTAHDALGAHARDELGLSHMTRARPLQAALSSAAAFAVGAALPLLLVVFLPLGGLSTIVIAASLALLMGLGALAGYLGGASMVRGAARVAFWGAAAMGATALVGRLFGTVV